MGASNTKSTGLVLLGAGLGYYVNLAFSGPFAIINQYIGISLLIVGIILVVKN